MKCSAKYCCECPLAKYCYDETLFDQFEVFELRSQNNQV